MHQIQSMNDPLRINLNSGAKGILKIGFLIRATVVLLVVFGAALFGLDVLKHNVLVAVISFAISLGLFIVFYRILDSAFLKESVIVTKDTITIVNNRLSSSGKETIGLDSIRYFGFAHTNFTPHTMDSPVLDITGLATQEREMQYVIDDGNVKIETASGTIKFGKNMPSWDVEELVEKIEAYSGRKFQRIPAEPSDEGESNEFEPDAGESNESGIPPNEEIENPASKVPTKQFEYKGDYGVLVIEQKFEMPSQEDMAYINGRPAPSGKYQIGENQFVLVSNGLIYAVRL